MGIFSKIKNALGFNKETPKEIENYDKGLEKSRHEFVSKLNNL